jgi:hypothetical protein
VGGRRRDEDESCGGELRIAGIYRVRTSLVVASAVVRRTADCATWTDVGVPDRVF